MIGSPTVPARVVNGISEWPPECILLPAVCVTALVPLLPTIMAAAMYLLATAALYPLVSRLDARLFTVLPSRGLWRFGMTWQALFLVHGAAGAGAHIIELAILVGGPFFLLQGIAIAPACRLKAHRSRRAVPFRVSFFAMFGLTGVAAFKVLS